MDETLNAVKLALRVTTNAFDSELTDLIQAAVLDLKVAGVTNDDTTNALVRRAVVTYCRMHFGEPDYYDRLKKSYDEQKAQMGMATGFTTWG
ncbi:MAG: phage gp6-like head-tail connector protein [Clostridia bacterium]|nr:phage gp6-like head-tail connector protein [Clostridia bacterium]